MSKRLVRECPRTRGRGEYCMLYGTPLSQLTWLHVIIEIFVVIPKLR